MSEGQGQESSPRDEVLLEQTSDDTDLGWGEQPEDEAADDERLRREKPPHW